MKRGIYIVCILLLWTETYAQTGVQGKIVAGDGKPVASANVSLFREGDTVAVRNVVAGETGAYELDRLEPGRYYLLYTAVGYRRFSAPAFALSDAPGKVNLAPVVLKEDIGQMQDVVVRAERPVFQHNLYGTVVNVGNSVLTKGSSVLQVLERSPGVYLDHHHNTISLNGKNGVLVMINGKVMRLPLSEVLDLLNGMSADNIEKIEIMTTPPAKYEAEGDAGIINIVMKQNKEYGTNGSATVTAGYGWGEKGSVSLSLDHNERTYDVYGTYSFNHDRSHEDWTSTGSEVLQEFGGQTDFAFWSVQKPVYNNHNVLAGIDAHVNQRTTIGANIDYSYNTTDNNTNNIGNYVALPDSFMQLKASVTGLATRSNLVASAYMENKLREGETLDFTADYIHFHVGNPSRVESTFTDKSGKPVDISDSLFAPHLSVLSNTTVDVGAGQLDYTRAWNKRVKLEAGGKLVYTGGSDLSTIQMESNGQWVSLLAEADPIHMSENIAAAYASLDLTLSPSTTLSAGARYEYSHTLLTDQAKDDIVTDLKLGKIFPTVFLTHKLSDRSALELSYSERINRPSYIDLAPNFTYNDPVSFFTGTPSLRPTISRNLKAGYSYKGYALSVLVGRDDDPIVRYQVVSSPAGNLAYISPENLTYQDNLIFEAKVPVKIGTWWEMNYEFVGGWRKFRADFTNPPAGLTWFDYIATGNQVFKLPGKWTIEVSGVYNSLTYGGVNKVKGFATMNAGVGKVLKNNGGTLQLSVSDVFRSMAFDSYLGQVSREPFSLVSQVHFHPETRTAQIVKLTYVRSFGKAHRDGGKKEHSASRDEQQRAN